MTRSLFPLWQGVSPAHLSVCIQAVVQQALDDSRRVGAYGHLWFVDRAKGLSVVALTKTLYEGMSRRFVTNLGDAIYDSLEAR